MNDQVMVGPGGMKITDRGRVLHGLAPNGVEIMILSPQGFPPVRLAPADVIAGIEREMIVTYQFIMNRKPANLP